MVWLFAGESMEGQWNSTRNIYEVDLFISMIGINFWIIPLRMKRVGEFIEIRHKKISPTCILSTLACLWLCDSVTLWLCDMCMLNAALNAKCHFLTCEERAALYTIHDAFLQALTGALSICKFEALCLCTFTFLIVFTCAWLWND